ncbi:MAG: hypothetical protein HYY86_03025 [Candidatus Harrisonbacteria bacterium]|nr:hypothetical protein [Candidatus Harrisonbacteria bacterium]
MPFYKRVIFGIIAMILLAAGIIGLAVPIVPHFSPMLLSLPFFRYAKIPIISSLVIGAGAISLLYVKRTLRLLDKKRNTRMRFKFYRLVATFKVYGNKLIGRRSKL